MPQCEITIYLPNMFMKKQDILVPTRRNKEADRTMGPDRNRALLFHPQSLHSTTSRVQNSQRETGTDTIFKAVTTGTSYIDKYYQTYIQLYQASLPFQNCPNAKYTPSTSQNPLSWALYA